MPRNAIASCVPQGFSQRTKLDEQPGASPTTVHGRALSSFGQRYRCFCASLCISYLRQEILTSCYTILQACQPKWCSPVYSNTVGPDAVYYEETACTSDVLDLGVEDFPGRLKFPSGSYLADVYYVASSADLSGPAGEGQGLCMPKDIELVDLRLHVACLPEQVLLCIGIFVIVCHKCCSAVEFDSKTSRIYLQDPFHAATLHRGTFMRYDCNNRSISFGCNQGCSKCNGTRSVEPELLKCRGKPPFQTEKKRGFLLLEFYISRNV